jgi:hypothetical protein
MTIMAILVAVYITSHTTPALEIMGFLGIHRVGIPTLAIIMVNPFTAPTNHTVPTIKAT